MHSVSACCCVCVYVMRRLCVVWLYLDFQDGWTALMWACDSGHTDVVQELIAGGAKVDLQTEVRPEINQ